MIKGDILGDGTYGIVYSCKDTDTGKEYAFKRNLSDKNTLFLSAIRELDLLTKLREHPHIVTLEFISYNSPFEENGFEPLVSKTRKDQQDDGIHFIFERAENNLYEYMKLNRNLDYGSRKRYMTQILLAIEYIHKHSIIHCDLKPQNILILEDKIDVLGQKSIIQICDFGLAVPYTYQGYQTSDVVTAWYRAPEILLGYPHYDYKSDIWSLGCIFFELIAGVQFLAGTPEKTNNLLSKILCSLPEEIPLKLMRSFNKWREINLYKYHKVDKNNPYFKKRKSWVEHLGLSKYELISFEKEAGNMELFSDLLNRMMEFDWDHRADISECLDHPFFEDQKMLIEETRKSYNPKKSFERLMYIVPCKERLWVKEVVKNIYRDKSKIKWYDHRIIFQSLSLFDSYIAGLYDDKDYNEPILTKQNTLLKFYSLLYMCVKYFTLIYNNISFNDVFGSEYRNKEIKLEIKNFELAIIQTLDHNIYRQTVYEAADNLNIFLTDDQTYKLLNAYLNIDKVITVTPTEFCRSIF